jgi:transcriptional regulator with XRE-family HTH domain
MAQDRGWFGRLVQRLRKARGLSEGELAARCGLDGQHIHSLENRTSNPRWRTLQLLAAGLGADFVVFADPDLKLPTGAPQSSAVSGNCHPARARAHPVGTFADKLRQLREARGLSPGELAQRAVLTRQALYGLEAGKHDPNWRTVQLLAAALGVDYGAFADVDLKCPGLRPSGRPGGGKGKAAGQEEKAQ